MEITASRPPNDNTCLVLDLLHEIIRHVGALQCSRKTLLNLMLTSRTICDITLPFLYRKIHINTRHQARGCLQTLLSNERAASYVQGLFITRNPSSGPTINIEDELAEFELPPLAPLFTRTLLRTTQLKTLAFDEILWTDLEHTSSSSNTHRWDAETKQIFDVLSQCTFSLDTFMTLLPLSQDCTLAWESIFSFLHKQARLRVLGFCWPPPEYLTRTLTLPLLERTTFLFNTAHEQDTRAFFSHFSQITDITLHWNQNPSRPEHCMLSGILECAASLAHLSIVIDMSNSSHILLPRVNVRSKTLHHLTVIMQGGFIDYPAIGLADIHAIPRDMISDLKTVFFGYRLPRLFDLTMWIQFVNWLPEMEGTTFYFDIGDGRVILAKRDKEDEKWSAQPVMWERVPQVHLLALDRAQLLVGETASKFFS